MISRLLPFLVLLSIAANAQVVLISEQGSTKPIELATIFSEFPKAYAATNAEGVADISLFKGAEKIIIQSFTHKTLITSWYKLDSLDFKVQLEKAIFFVSEVVISANRTQQAKEDIAQKISSITSKDNTFQNPQTAADLLATSGDVFIQKSQQGGGSPMIRGFATNRLLYTVDGVRMNNAIFRSGNIQNVINIDPFAVTTTEVLFGGNSVIYGSDAIGGVMSFQTLKPQLSLSENTLVTGKTNARYASANEENTFHFDLNVGSKKWALVSSFSTWDYDHLRQGSRGPDDYLKTTFVERRNDSDYVVTQNDELLQIPSGYTQQNIMQKIRFKPNKKWDFTYGFHFSQTSNYGRYDRHNRERNGTARYAEWSYGPQEWMMNVFKAKNLHKTKLYDELVVRLAHQNFKESRITRNLNNDARTTNSENVAAYSLNIDLTKAWRKKNRVYYGVEAVTNNVQSEGTIENITDRTFTKGASRYPNANWSSVAVYANNDFKINKKLSLQIGTRYNQIIIDANFDTIFFPLPVTNTKLNNNAVTGSAGGVYRPNKKLTITLSASTAFRAPNIDDIGKVFDSEPESVIVPNTNLEAEYAYNLDFGIAKRIGKFANLEFNAYYTLLQNALIRRDFQLAGRDSIIYDGELSQVQAIQNASSAYVYGFQLSTDINITKNISWITKVNYQKGEEEQEDGTTSNSRHAAPLFGLSRLNYSVAKTQLQLYIVFQGKQSAENLNIGEQNKTEIYALNSNGRAFSPAWQTLNFKAQQMVGKKTSISAGIENITNQRYRPYSSGLSGAGRNFIMGVQVKF